MKPIIFSTEMVKAILDGRKTQTRRIIKPQPMLKLYPNFENKSWHWKDCHWLEGGIGFPTSGIEDYSPYKPGDILWVRETWCEVPYETKCIKSGDGFLCVPKKAYKADSKIDFTGIWKSPIHIPKEAARIFLRVVGVEVERLQDISEEDAIAEGVNGLEAAC